MKAWAERFYGSASWHACRDGFLASRHGLCERCSARGDAVPAKIAHHRIALTPVNISDPMVALNWDNLEALCQDCHNREHHGSGVPRRYRFDEDGNVLPEMYGV